MYRTRSLYTTAGFQVQQNLFWQMMTDDQCETIASTAMELLERTGVDVLSKDAQATLKEGGCFVEGDRVRIPSAKAQWALRVAPTRVTLCDRNGNRAMMLENNESYWGPGYTSKVFMEQDQNMDTNNNKFRPFTLADVETYGKLCETLPNIGFAMAGGYPTDVDEKVAEVESFKTLVKTTTKPIIQNVKNVEQATAVYNMVEAVAGSPEKAAMDPFAALHVVVNEPLQISAEAADVVAFAAGHGVPVIVSNELVSGLTAPAESAGVLIVALANSLAMLVLAQLTQEGASFITGGFFTNNDTANGLQPYGSPEISLLGGGFAGVLRYLRIPSFGFAGATDSKISDAQMGLEVAFSVLSAGLAGTNVIHGAGNFESGCASNPAVLVLADEIACETKRITRGVEMDEDRLARGVIEEVKPAGNYLATKHTRYYFRSEQFWPTLMNRKRIDDWEAEGALTLGERTVNKMNNLLVAYEQTPLPDGVDLDKIAG